MKRICGFLVASILCLSAITVSYAAAPSFAATKWCSPPTGFGGGSRVIPTDTIVSYSDLRDYRVAVNKWLSEGQYSGFHGTASLHIPALFTSFSLFRMVMFTGCAMVVVVGIALTKSLLLMIPFLPPSPLLLHRLLIKPNRLRLTIPIFQTRLHPVIRQMSWMHLTA